MTNLCRLTALTAMIILLAGCGARQSGPLEQQIDAIISPASQSGNFSGSVLVTRNDQSIYEKSFGLADLDQKIANTAATKFLAFSVVKPMTAVLVFQLIDAGQLRLTDSLDSVFANLQGKPAGRITLQQLLTHTSGLPEIISQHLDRRMTARDLELVVPKPSAGFEYSNTGYVCLGLVLEATTGKSYEALLQEKVLQPAGMKDSGLVRTGQVISTLARGYHLQDGRIAPAELGVAMEVLDGAGSLFTTARDLWRFDRALAAGTILSRESQALMLTQQIKGRYGYGWFLSEQSGRYFPWHQGEFRGYSAVLVRQIHRHETIVILSNLEQADVLELRSKILRVLKASPAR